MKVKTCDLSGVALDWAVARADSLQIIIRSKFIQVWLPNALTKEPEILVTYRPSKSWAQGGPIVERIRGFEFKQWLESNEETRCEVHIHNYEGNWVAFGPTLLIAAMRCFVASKLGDEIEIPEEL